MSDQFLGEVRLVASSFPPRGWATCDGQLIAISANDTLFSLYGTRYGGDGRTTFGLPEMRGRVPMHYGTGPGLTPRPLGQRLGTPTVTLTTQQLPVHTHTFNASNKKAGFTSPHGTQVGDVSEISWFYKSEETPYRNMGTKSIGNTGGSQPHMNMAPFLGIYFICAMVGVYPKRN